MTTIDLGDRFGLLTVIGKAGSRVRPSGQKAAYWVVRCDCGQVKEMCTGQLRSGHSVSCGHLSQERLVAASTKHGMATRSKKSPEYVAWTAMRGRCLNGRRRDYKNYGGRGIGFCKEWDSFQQFFQDMGSRPSPMHSLDRIKVEGNYEPGNCRWATVIEQAGNKRSVKIFVFEGKSWNLRSFCRAYGIDYKSAHYFMNRRNASIAEVLSKARRSA